MNNTNSNDTSLNVDEITFCSVCGKILSSAKGRLKCPKCGEAISASVSENQGAIQEKINKEDINQIRAKIKEPWQKYFPYLKIRPLQNQIIEKIQEGCESRAHIIIEAANGVGKTIAVLAAILPYSLKTKKTVVYCCRTHQQMSRVISELKMVNQLTPVSGIALRGRKDLCLNSIVQKFAIDAGNAADICRYLKKEGKCKFFNNIADKKKMSQIKGITQNQVLDSQEILNKGKSIEVCPYEISKRLISDVNVVAASYQHIFNPFVRNSFLMSLEKDITDIILVVDEAHNLPSTAVDISSSSLSNFTLEGAQSEALKQKTGEAYDFLEALTNALTQETKKLVLDEEIRIDPKIFLYNVEKRSRISVDEDFIESLSNLADHVKKEQINRNKAPMSYTSSVVNFITQLLETKGRTDYAHFVSKSESRSGNPISRITALSLDPRVVTENIFTDVFLSVSTSGTLEPIEAYVSLIGLNQSRVDSLILPSPYEKENSVTVVIDKISSKLEDRIPATYAKMKEIVKTVVEATPINTGVFCASYSVMESLLKTGLERVISKPIFITHKGMSSLENDKLINDFKKESKKAGGVLFSVLGGRASEGSDYPAAEMQSVIIVGIPYAKPSPTIDASIEYLDSQFPTKGREYGYNIPALTRASQAAGRPIRSLEDFAVIVLMDYRFARYYYKKHLPIWLKQNMSIVQPENQEIYERVKKFYDYHYV